MSNENLVTSRVVEADAVTGRPNACARIIAKEMIDGWDVLTVETDKRNDGVVQAVRLSELDWHLTEAHMFDPGRRCSQVNLGRFMAEVDRLARDRDPRLGEPCLRDAGHVILIDLGSQPLAHWCADPVLNPATRNRRIGQ